MAGREGLIRAPAPGPPPAAWLPLAPGITAAVLALPTVRWGYLWDDYQLLARARRPLAQTILPDPALSLYRPLSREVYFGLLVRLGHWGPVAAHMIQILLLVLVVWLLTRLAARLLGTRAGLAAGFAFAGFYALPLLVGWASLAQDLLAMTFFLAAAHLHLSGRRWPAAALFAASLLSKETAIALLPALVLLDWAAGRGTRGIWREAVRYGAVAAAWLAIHPGVHYVLSHRGAAESSSGYVALGQPESLSSAGKSLLSLANIPVLTTFGPVSRGIVAAVLAALALAVLALRSAWSRRSPSPGPRPADRRRALAFAAVIVLPAVLLTSSLIGHWAPYYACVPAIGGAIAAGALLSAPRSVWVPLSALALFLGLGAACRAMQLDPSTPSEEALESSDRDLRHTRAAFFRVCPEMPRGATAYVSIGTTGDCAVYPHLSELQALSAWYDDPTLVTRPPERRRAAGGPELLFRVQPDRSVIRIDPASHRLSASEGAPDEAQALTAIRSYALGLAGSGETDRGVRLLMETPVAEPLHRDWNGRLAALILLAANRTEEAHRLLAPLPPLPEEIAYAVLFGTLSVAPPGLSLEPYAMEAFGFAPTDTTVLRAAMEDAVRLKYEKLAVLLARRMLGQEPGDEESRALIERLGRERTGPVPVPPIDVDSK